MEPPYKHIPKKEVLVVLSVKELERFLLADGQELEQIDLEKFRAGDVFRVQTIRGDIYFIQITVAISHRADVYRYDGKKYSLEKSYLGNYHFSESINLRGFAYGDKYSFTVCKLERILFEQPR